MYINFFLKMFNVHAWSTLEELRVEIYGKQILNKKRQLKKKPI